MVLQLHVTHGGGGGAAAMAAAWQVEGTLTVLDKPTTRRTESMSMRFAPSAALAAARSVQVHKVASWTSPLAVATNGSKHLHYASAERGVRWQRSQGGGGGGGDSGDAHATLGADAHAPGPDAHALSLLSLDAGLVVVGEDSRPVLGC